MGVPEAHGAHGAPSASGPEIYPHGAPSASGPGIHPHGGVLEAHRPWPIGLGPSAPAYGAHGAPYGHVFLAHVFLAQSRPSWGVNPSTPWPPGGFRPNLCSTKIASRASQGPSGHPVPVYTNLQIQKNSIFLIFFCFFFDLGSILDPSYI